MKKILVFCLSVLVVSASFILSASEKLSILKGQTLYVPVYTQILEGDKSRPFKLAATLSIRNTDFNESITIISVDYYGADGKLIERFVERPVTLAQLAATNYFIKESDVRGGAQTFFIVRWSSGRPVREPIINAIMIGTAMSQGISFTNPARILEEVK